MSTKISAAAFLEKDLGPMSFGTFLTSVRELLGLTQAALARKLKVSRSMVCDLEKGRVIASARMAARIAKVAGFPPQFAVRYCLQDQVRRANLRLKIEVKAA